MRYNFTLLYAKEFSEKKQKIIDILRLYLDLYNDNKVTNTLLLYKRSKDKKFVRYYFTSLNKKVSNKFVESCKTQICEKPSYRTDNSLSKLKFLDGDIELFQEINLKS